MTTDVANEQQKASPKNRAGWIVPKGEKASYFIGSGSHFTVHTFMSAFLTTYLLMIGVNLATSATVMLVLRAWDAVNDTIFGYIIDRVRFTPGKSWFSRWFFSGRYLP